ncbi:MAG: radical SAM protein [Bacteroidetes bacterium]|nr:radical SAM protein [Bacteroidota bacterium]
MMITGFWMNMVRYRMILNAMIITFLQVRNLGRTIVVLKEMLKLMNGLMTERKPLKMVKANGRYFWEVNSPGFPCKALSNNVRGEVNRIIPTTGKGKYNRFRVVLIGITKKCPMQCEHCYEWDTLNREEVLSLEDLHSIVGKFQRIGVGQIQFGGGEPLSRFNDLISVLESAEKTADFWITTSGFMLTEEKTILLKQAGLTGVSVSLDHYIAEKHNQFRGHKEAFNWAEKAIANCQKAGLLVSVSLCATNEFVSGKNLYAYAETVKKTGVGFIQILEPRRAGKYREANVHLTEENIKILEEFTLNMNFNKAFKQYPIIIYHGLYQRKIGCFGAGNRYLYVDTDGDIHACPFCRGKSGNALSDNIEECIGKIRTAGGCHLYHESIA